MKKISFAILMTSLILFSSCDQSGLDNSEKSFSLIISTAQQVDPALILGNLDLTIRENEEAELMALCLSGQIFAPEELCNRVLNELSAIRSTFGGIDPHMEHITFMPPFVAGQIMIAFDEATMQQVQNGAYTSWNDLNRASGMEKGTIKIYDHFVVVTSKYRLHPLLLAAYYSSLPGVIYAEPDGIIGDGSRIYPRISGNKISYLFKYGAGDCSSGCTYAHYFYFIVDNDVPELIGDWEPGAEEKPAWWGEAENNINTYRSFIK